MSAQDLIDDCRSVGIVFPEVMTAEDYEALFAIQAVINLASARLRNVNPLSATLPALS